MKTIETDSDMKMQIIKVTIVFILSVVTILKIECKQDDSQIRKPDERLEETNNLTDPTYQLTKNKTTLNKRTISGSTTNVFLIVLFVMILICCCMSITQK